ncbi:MAG: hypothetical protein ACXW3V_04565, partial [Methylocystis sp.]
MQRAQLFSSGLVVALLFLASAHSPALASDAELPKRRPGLWRISTISPEIGLQTNDVCIEEG